MRDHKIYLPCWVYFLSELESDNNCSSSISKKCDVTYSHTTNVLSNMVELGWLNKEKHGRRVLYTLTKCGKELSVRCKDIILHLNEVKRDSDKSNSILLKDLQ